MKEMIVGDALSPDVARVLKEEFPNETSEQMVFAVFTELGENGVFCGLVTSEEVAQQPHLNFGDLIKDREIHAVPPDATFYQALTTMNQENLSGLPVLNELGKLIGVITHQGLMHGIAQNARDCLSELQSLRNQIEELDRNAMVRMARLVQLDKTSKELLSVLGITSVETNLLQVGIEALTNLMRVRYGAIGILDESDESGKALKHFIHTGITPEIVKSIGRVPEGKGLLGAVIRKNAVIRLEDMSKDSESSGFPPNHPPMKSLLAVPISYGHHVYGRIYLSEKLNGLPFSEDDATLVQNFASSIAKALNGSLRSGLSARE